MNLSIMNKPKTLTEFCPACTVISDEREREKIRRDLYFTVLAILTVQFPIRNLHKELVSYPLW
jgi:hypothetical protein